MKKFLCLFIVTILYVPANSYGKDDAVCIDTAFKLVGANHKVCVFTFQDPLIQEITCKISHARTGGIGGTLGVAEDIARFSLSCVQTADIKQLPKLKEKEEVYKQSTDMFFKKTKVYRIVQDDSVITYLAISDKLIDGSPFNSISAVAIKKEK